MEMTSARGGRRFWHIVRLVFLGFSKNKLMVDLDLLLKRGKIAGKALSHLLSHHHHHHGGGAGGGGAASMYSALTCQSMDPNLAFYSPREVQFSFSNTPSYPTFRRHRRRRHHRRYDDDDAVFKAIEILNAEADIDNDGGGEDEEYSASAVATPSLAIWKSPAAQVRQLRITDSPINILASTGKQKEEKSEEADRDDHQKESADEESITVLKSRIRRQVQNIVMIDSVTVSCQ
ncbi:hypothetical protein ZIOFF_049607 [Zingiber officinale]|uniref:Uncharacterized protein n=1 Tax=Zingiber officinale TaxID=94328 RepID=A0A8J5FZ36_ZINOF|nr:hypothetical protein ZIOFF_049607 [Zingiber officinale]